MHVSYMGVPSFSGRGGGGGGQDRARGRHLTAAYIWEVIAAKIHAPYSMIGGRGGGGGVVKCCGLLHKTITYQPLFHTIGYYYS